MVARAEAILRDAKAFAHHLGFDFEIEMDGETGIRVPVTLEGDTDQLAYAHLKQHEAVLGTLDKDGKPYLVLRR
ncbi:MAG: hypothetical protein KC731_27625 [Myxococcales bacterium]|nr:hypothetical protein [Myxococcales bacterium]